ncbi:MAG TPA: acyl-ACP--UDP-N-acetylglucosamine O-acyltransferase [Gammaproteobacteria bacterium]|nr:acyl-ACP--UDP-N-acetylglucosamine O-acyltransferase [Gammaproteobacteria bacterium]
MIDPRAVIDARAELAADVRVGPFAVIGPEVVIGPGCEIGSHVVIKGPTRIGSNNKIFQFASIGDDPQDKKYQGEPTRLEIGDGNVIREYCTINRGTVQGGGLTRVGDDNWIMAYVHIAHDCIVGNHTIFANNASLAGHVKIEDYVILGGFSLVHQFCNLGAHCFTAFSAGIAKDVPPFVMVGGYAAAPHGLNIEGLKRRGFSAQTIANLRRAYKILYRSGLTFKNAIEQLKAFSPEEPEVARMVTFLEKSRRGIVR